MESRHQKIDILYYDEHLAVINKPEGILSVPFPGFKGRTAQSVLEDLLRARGCANSRHHPYAVHRLDRDTSGVMMFALTEKAQAKIMDSWHKMVSGRVYRALTYRAPKMRVLPFEIDSRPGSEGDINAPLAKNAYNIGFVPKAGATDKKGRPFRTEPARTHYKVIKAGKKYLLFELELDTGKKNQIRAHLAAAGYPLLGDQEHRSSENPFNRLCLHARTLEFTHPFNGEKLKFEVPEPASWEDFPR